MADLSVENRGWNSSWMDPPPSTWMPELHGDELHHAWKFAAGVNPDGSPKHHTKHTVARYDIKRAAVIANKPPTQKESAKASRKRYKDKAARELDAKKTASMNKIMFALQVKISDGPLSDEDAFRYVLNLIGDRVSETGKQLMDALGGNTLREALWDGRAPVAIYPSATRGHGGVGGSAAEGIRFIVNDPSPVLRCAPDNQHFKFMDTGFKDLDLSYVPIYITYSYANCTTMERAFQLFFDYLTIGSQRLWKQSGAGNFGRSLRSCDMKYVERTGDKSPKFMVGLTILSNVSVIEKGVDENGSDVVKLITGGNGTKCTVNQPKMSVPLMTKSQEIARDAAWATLPRRGYAAADEIMEECTGHGAQRGEFGIVELIDAGARPYELDDMVVDEDVAHKI